MRVALVHDDLVQWGGAERVLLAVSEIYPEAPIYTSVFDKTNINLKKYFSGKKIVTSFVQKIPWSKNLYKTLLPLYPIAFEQFDFSNYDLVISNTTRFAKSIITKPETLHICYCHTPPRFLWNYSGERPHFWLAKYLSFLRIYDLVSARRVDHFIAGSQNAAQRIKKIYQKKASVCLPLVEDIFFQESSFDAGYYLIISRLNRYKKLDIAVKAFNENGKKLKIVGSGPELSSLKKQANSNIEFCELISENLLLSLIQGCKALIITSEEDFGLTSLEAQACGKPVIALGRGGAKETIKKDITGILFQEQSSSVLSLAIDEFEMMIFKKQDMIDNSSQFTKEIFKKNFQSLVNQLIN